jgi:hypothetical protein
MDIASLSYATDVLRFVPKPFMPSQRNLKLYAVRYAIRKMRANHAFAFINLRQEFEQFRKAGAGSLV